MPSIAEIGEAINIKITALREEIIALETKETSEQKKIDKSIANKTLITNNLNQKRSNLHDQLEEFYRLYQAHLEQREAEIAEKEATSKADAPMK